MHIHGTTNRWWRELLAAVLAVLAVSAIVLSRSDDQPSAEQKSSNTEEHESAGVSDASVARVDPATSDPTIRSVGVDAVPVAAGENSQGEAGEEVLLMGEGPDDAPVWVVVDVPEGWSRRPVSNRNRVSLHTPYGDGQGEQAAGWGLVEITIRDVTDSTSTLTGDSTVVMPGDSSNELFIASELRSFEPDFHGRVPWTYLNRTLSPTLASRIEFVNVDVTATLEKTEVDKSPEKLIEVQEIIESVRLTPNLIGDVSWSSHGVQWDDSAYGHAYLVIPESWSIVADSDASVMTIAGTGGDAGLQIIVRRASLEGGTTAEVNDANLFGCRVIDRDESMVLLKCGMEANELDDAYFAVTVAYPEMIGSGTEVDDYWRDRQLINTIMTRSSLRSSSGGDITSPPGARPTPGP